MQELEQVNFVSDDCKTEASFHGNMLGMDLIGQNISYWHTAHTNQSKYCMIIGGSSGIPVDFDCSSCKNKSTWAWTLLIRN